MTLTLTEISQFRELKKTGGLLLLMMHLNRPTGPVELAEIMEMNLGTVRRYLDSLFSAGLITRLHRRNGYILTSRGAELVQAPFLSRYGDDHFEEETFELDTSDYRQFSENATDKNEHYHDHDTDENEQFSESTSDHYERFDGTTDNNAPYPEGETDKNRQYNEKPTDKNEHFSDRASDKNARYRDRIDKNKQFDVRDSDKNARYRGDTDKNARFHSSSSTTTAFNSLIFNQEVAAVEEENRPKKPDLSPAGWANLNAFREAGVGPNNRVIALCREEYVTPGYIRLHAQRLRREKRFNPGLLISVIESGDPLPEEPDPEDNSRYVTGRYAEFINH